MSINLRNALMTGKRPPYQCELEYLESTGTQYIDTGVYADLNTVAEVFGCSTNNTSISWIFGARNSYNTRAFAIYNGSDVQYKYTVSYDSIGVNRIISNVSSQTGNMVFMRLGANTVIDSWTATYSDATEFTTSSTILVFACWQNGVMYGKCKISSFKIYQNGTLVRDFIPVLDWSGVACMYDRVTGKCFYNAGTGAFVASEIHEVEYIESTGTQWIKTGIDLYGATNFEYDVMFSPSTVVNQQRVMSTEGSSPTYDIYFTSATTLAVRPMNKGSSIAVGDLMHITYTGGKLQIYKNGQTQGNWDYTFSPVANQMELTLMVRANSTAQSYRFLGKFYNTKFWVDNVLVRDYKPIRVGSGSTWEGAMLDTVNRRVYRNAGTGAFTYGNDLKYPIPAA